MFREEFESMIAFTGMNPDGESSQTVRVMEHDFANRLGKHWDNQCEESTKTQSDTHTNNAETSKDPDNPRCFLCGDYETCWGLQYGNRGKENCYRERACDILRGYIGMFRRFINGDDDEDESLDDMDSSETKSRDDHGSDGDGEGVQIQRLTRLTGSRSMLKIFKTPTKKVEMIKQPKLVVAVLPTRMRAKMTASTAVLMEMNTRRSPKGERTSAATNSHIWPGITYGNV